MHFSVSFKVLGLLLMVFSSTMLTPLIFALVEGDYTVQAFLTALGLTFFSGLLLWLPARNSSHELQIRDGFLVTSLFWTVLGLFGALPLLLTDALHLTPAAAIFESISGLTSAGGTVIVGLDTLPRSILLWRQLLQWMGGIGIIVIAVAVLPMLGIGGMQLYKAETPGPSKNSKLTPRITETAKMLFAVYLTITIACATTYYLLGMSVFDAIGHSFSTVSLGGFSTHDASMGFFKNDYILVASSFFMLVSAMNFGLHYMVWHRKSIRIYAGDSETRFFFAAIAICVGITIGYLLYAEIQGPRVSIIHGLFQVVSIVTTTGYSSEYLATWPVMLPVMAIFFSCMGGCVGSTTGGIKAMRVMLMYKQGVRELKQLVHPNAIIPLKVGKRRVEASIVSAVWSFFAVYTSAFIILTLLIMATGQDFLTAFAAVAACINNSGIGIGNVGSNFSPLSETAKLLLSFAMLLGRLEFFTLLVLFTPAFWRR